MTYISDNRHSGRPPFRAGDELFVMADCSAAGDKKKVKLIRSGAEKAIYMQSLLRDMQVLEQLLSEDAFEYRVRLGSELELNLIDNETFKPAPLALDIHDQLDHSHFTTEFALFNLEINSEPFDCTRKCLSNLSRALSEDLNSVREKIRSRHCSVLLTGIIPTLTEADITPNALTPEPRFQALHDVRNERRGEGYEFNIRGTDELIARDNIMLFAGCMTSFQLHMQVNSTQLAEKYNWAQMIAGPLLAASSNSPLFLGKRLWSETRIALFEQAADTRNPSLKISDQQGRVCFGNQWIEDSILELFHDDIATFEPLFTFFEEPASGEREPEEPGFEEHGAEERESSPPGLRAWNLFNGSIYRWNRVCYGITEGKPSLRIENRILPSGPTVQDMVANAAFWLGLMNGMPAEYADFHKRFEFSNARDNFFKAARLGLDVQFSWLGNSPVPAHELIRNELLPMARQGLRQAGISNSDAKHYLGIIEARVSSRRTGSNWISESYRKLLTQGTRDEALTALTSAMITRQESDRPVHTWDLADIQEAGGWRNRNSLRNYMTTALYKVDEEDVVDLAAHIMTWKHVGHIPVENRAGELIGLITRNTFIDYILHAADRTAATNVKDIMVGDPVTAHPDMPLAEAIQLMTQKKVSCLPVVKDKKIVGIVTERDFLYISHYLVAELDRRDQHDHADKRTH